MRWIFEPIARRSGIKSRRALVRFAEQGWSLTYYGPSPPRPSRRTRSAELTNCSLATACSWLVGLVRPPLPLDPLLNLGTSLTSPSRSQYINQTSPYASLNTLHFWKGYPHDALPALTKWYCASTLSPLMSFLPRADLSLPPRTDLVSTACASSSPRLSPSACATAS